MKKLEQLSPEQEQKMMSIRDFWLNYIFSCKNQVNKEAAKIGIDWLYKLAGKNEPVIIHVDSPMACQYAVHYLKAYTKVIEKLLGERSEPSMAQVRDQVGDQKMEYQSFAWIQGGSIADYYWVSFYDFFTQIGVINHEGFNQFKNVLLSGIYDMIQLNGYCIVSSLPKRIIRNASGRLHNPTGPAIEFADGYAQYYVNGRALPAWIWEKAAAGEITKEMFLQETNSEIKGGMYEVLGQKKMMDLLGAVEIDCRTIPHKNGDLETVKLLKTTERFAEIDNKPFAWVSMVCPSTGSQYLQGVEPHHTNAIEAIASLSPFKPEEYSFDLRS